MITPWRFQFFFDSSLRFAYSTDAWKLLQIQEYHFHFVTFVFFACVGGGVYHIPTNLCLVPFIFCNIYSIFSCWQFVLLKIFILWYLHNEFLILVKFAVWVLRLQFAMSLANWPDMVLQTWTQISKHDRIQYMLQYWLPLYHKKM